MQSTTHVLRVFTVFLVIISTSVSAHAVQLVKTKPIDHTSPQKIAKDLTQAFKKGDLKRASACMTWKSRATVFAMMTTTAVLATVVNKSKRESFQELSKQLGVSKSDDPEKLFKDSNRIAADLVALEDWLQKHLPKVNGKRQPSFGEQLAAARYVNFKINGDVATADVIQDGKKTPTKAYFKRIEGKWYMDFYEASQHGKTPLKFKFKKK